MPELKELQIDFQQYLLTEQPHIEANVVNTPLVPAKDRLEIYREAYYLRLLEALQQDYVVLNHLMGDEAFNELGVDYIDAHPSSFRSIRWFGKELADFMKKSSAYSNQDAFIEMAAFEWLLTESFDAPDCIVLTIEGMAAISPDTWPSLHLRLPPSLRKLILNWNTVHNWNTYQEKGACLAPEKTHATESWIIWRKAYEVQFRSLSQCEAQMINGLLSGNNIGEICEGLCAWLSDEEVSMQLATCLKQFIFDELIVGVSP